VRIEPFVQILNECTRIDHIKAIVGVIDGMFCDDALELTEQEWSALSKTVAESKGRIERSGVAE